MAPDPTVSAIVELEGAAAGADASGAAGPPRDLATIAKTKSYFTNAGFEVHAPLGMSFSIAAKRSHFEEYFGQKLAIDDEDLFAAVPTEAGDAVLPLDPLPDDIRPMVRGVSFPPAPDLGPRREAALGGLAKLRQACGMRRPRARTIGKRVVPVVALAGLFLRLGRTTVNRLTRDDWFGYAPGTTVTRFPRFPVLRPKHVARLVWMVLIVLWGALSARLLRRPE